MQLSRQAGTTSQTIYVRIQDSSSSTGAGKTGLVFNTSSLTAYYVRRGGASTAITLVTQTVTGAWTSGGFVEVDSTNQPGLYRLDVPNACLAASADQVVITLRGASGMVDRPVLIELTAWNNQVANIGADVQTVKGQTTTCSAPIAIAPFVGNANAVLAVDNSGRVDLGKILGTASAAPAGTVAMDWGATANRTATVSLTGTTLNLVTTVTTATTVTNLTNAPTAGDFTATMKTSAQTAAAAAITAASLSTASGLASAQTTLNTINTTVATNLDTNVGSRAATGAAMSLTSGERTTLAGVVWNSLTSGFTTAGSIGKKLADWVIGTTQTADVATVITATTAIKAKTDLIATNSADSPNAVTAQGILNATASVIETDIPAIKSQTDQMQFDGSGFIQADVEDVGGQHALSTGGQLWGLSSAGNSVAEAIEQSAIKSQTDKLVFDGSNNCKSTPQTSVTLATSQPNYAPAKAGDRMDLVNAPNSVAISAITLGLSTTTSVSSGFAALQSHGDTAWATATGFALANSAPSWYTAPSNSTIATMATTVASLSTNGVKLLATAFVNIPVVKPASSDCTTWTYDQWLLCNSFARVGGWLKTFDTDSGEGTFTVKDGNGHTAFTMAVTSNSDGTSQTIAAAA